MLKLGLLFLLVRIPFLSVLLSKAVFIYVVRSPHFISSPCFILSPESAFYTYSVFYTQSGVRVLYLVRILYSVRSPCFILTVSIITCTVSSSFGLVFLTGGKKNSEL